MQSPFEKKIPCPFSVLDQAQTQYLFFLPNLYTSIYNCVSNCQEYSLKLINKTAGFVKVFLVEYLLTARSAMPDISTSVLKQKKYNMTCDDDV